MARGLKFRIEKVNGLYYLCSENNFRRWSASRLPRSWSASLFFAYAKRWFSHHAAYIWAGGHLGHVTRMPWTNFRSLFTRRLHIKFNFNLPSGFKVEDVWNCWRRTTDGRTISSPMSLRLSWAKNVRRLGLDFLRERPRVSSETD